MSDMVVNGNVLLGRSRKKKTAASASSMAALIPERRILTT